MKTIVDTSVWSLVLRRDPRDALKQQPLRLELRELIATERAVIVGPVRREILSGIVDNKVFQRLRDRLRDFPDELLLTAGFEQATRCSNVCRSAGISGSSVDFRLCALALRRNFSIFTTDADFE